MAGIKGFVVMIGEVVHNLLRPNVTVMYPSQMVPPPDGFRGAPEVHPELCILCKACERECPTHCIKIEAAKDTPADPAKGDPFAFSIALAQCMYCQVCEEYCPIGKKGKAPAAIRLNKDRWRNACFDTNAVTETKIVYKKKKAAQADGEE